MKSVASPIDKIKEKNKSRIQLKKFLIGLITKYWDNLKYLPKKEPLQKNDLVDSDCSDLWELAIALASAPVLTWVRAKGKDFVENKADAKCFLTQKKQNIKQEGKEQWTHCAQIKGILNKEGPLYILAWDVIKNMPLFFHVPHEAFFGKVQMVEIVFERYKSTKKIRYIHEPFTGTIKRTYKWWEYECNSFEDMLKLDKIKKAA